MKFYKKLNTLILVSVIIAIIIVGFIIFIALTTREGALTKAQLYSDANKKEQQARDDAVNAETSSKKDLIKNLGSTPGRMVASFAPSTSFAPSGSPSASPSASPSPFNIKYDPNKMLSDSYASLNPELNGSEKESKQKKFDVSVNLLHPHPVYYEPGSFPFSSTGYIPNYEDSVYLSRTTKLSQIGVIQQAPYIQGGFCTQFANDNLAKNEKCGTLDQATCASTNCCVLMGGTKCVAGDLNGPTLKTVYSDVTIPNRDYWYYQGKCAGNCP